MDKKLKEYLNYEINENCLSHAFLIETNNCELLLNEIYELFIENDIISNKGINNNLSINIIRPENNLIDKNKILDLQKFVITKSFEKKHKVYFILNCELMNVTSSNKLLKVLEEPNDNVIGILITENENSLLNTIKSRCIKFKSFYEIEKKNNENDNIIMQIYKICNIDYTNFINLKKNLLKFEKNEIIELLQKTKNLINEDYVNNQESILLAKQYKILDNIVDLIKSNVNLELCIDKLYIEMRKKIC